MAPQQQNDQKKLKEHKENIELGKVVSEMEKIIGDLENDARVLADQHKLLKSPTPKKTPKKQVSSSSSEAKTPAQPIAKKKPSTTSNNSKSAPKKKSSNSTRKKSVSSVRPSSVGNTGSKINNLVLKNFASNNLIKYQPSNSRPYHPNKSNSRTYHPNKSNSKQSPMVINYKPKKENVEKSGSNLISKKEWKKRPSPTVINSAPKNNPTAVSRAGSTTATLTRNILLIRKLANLTHMAPSTSSSPSAPNVNCALIPQEPKRPSSAAGRLYHNPNQEKGNTSLSSLTVNSLKYQPVKTITSVHSKRVASKTSTKQLPVPKNFDIYTPFLITVDQLSFIKEIVERAIAHRKTFTVVGNFVTIRKAMENRGWVEKLRISYNTHDQENLRKLQAMSIPDLMEKVNDKQVGQLHKRMVMSKLLARHQVDFYWDQTVEAFKHNPDKIKYTLINTIKRGGLSYASKLGLCESVKRAHWYQIPNVCSLSHPRSYGLTNNGDPYEFIKDFKLTAAMSLLKWIISIHGSIQYKLISDYGKIPISAFHFAMTECTKLFRTSNHEDIDGPIDDAPDFEWNQFLDHYYKAIHVGCHFKTNDLETEDTMFRKSKIVLDKLRPVWPYLDMDGMMNIWILKPIHGSRGIGIYICRTLQYVLKVITENQNCRYVIQKYIERPLLIYNTKFDIRQWFLISSTTPLTIWIYKECYLRFSSQTYNLRKLHESIHLTNNSVQCRYKNCNRDPGLPQYNMWDRKQFEDYLENVGFPDVFEKKIYPGMKQNIIAAILLNQDFITPRRNCFELYGADFMLTEDFQPWLIEINSRPALYASTPVTTRMCREVLEDVVKVVIDFAQNPASKTGNFEVIYKEKKIPLPPVDLDSLKLEGRPISTEYFAHDNVRPETPKKRSELNLTDTKHYLSYVSKEMKESLLKLLKIIQGERDRRRKLYGEVKKEGRTATATTENTDEQKKSDKNLGSALKLNEIFTQTFGEVDRISDGFDSEAKQSYLSIKDEFEEIFKHPEFMGDDKSDVLSSDAFSTPTTTYGSTQTSIEKVNKVFDTNPQYIFKNVLNMLDTFKEEVKKID